MSGNGKRATNVVLKSNEKQIWLSHLILLNFLYLDNMPLGQRNSSSHNSSFVRPFTGLSGQVRTPSLIPIPAKSNQLSNAIFAQNIRLLPFLGKALSEMAPYRLILIGGKQAQPSLVGKTENCDHGLRYSTSVSSAELTEKQNSAQTAQDMPMRLWMVLYRRFWSPLSSTLRLLIVRICLIFSVQ